MGEGVRADRHQYHGFQARIDNRPAAGQRVGGGAGRGGDDQAVGAIGVQKPSVQKGLHIDHSRDIALMDHHIVQGVRLADHAAVAHDLGVQQQAAGFAELAVQHAVQPVWDFTGGNIGQKPQPSQVDPQDRHIVVHQRTGGVEHGAIAAHDHHQIALLADGGAAGDFQAAIRDQLGRAFVEQHP